LIVAPDGTVWVLDEGRNRVLAVAPSGRIARSFVLDADAGFGSSVRDGITVGPDGAIWFVEPALGKIGRIGCPGTK
jgi:virginiamycin B lyase